MQVPGLHGLSVRTLMTRAVSDFLRDDLATYAAALAYHLLFAVFPFLLFLIALLGFFDLQELFSGLLEQAEQALPDQAMAQVQQVLSEVSEERGDLLSFGAVLSVWFASLGMRSAMNALNQAYDVEEGRSRWKRYSLSVVYTVAFAVLVAVATALMMLGPALAIELAERLGLGEATQQAWRWLRVPAAMFLAMLAVSLVYHFAPNVEQPFRVATAGSIFTVLLWVVVSFGFRFYVANFGRYSVVYGSVGAVIVLLLYFFLSSVVLLLGGEVNAILDRHVTGRRALEESGEHPE